MLTERDLGNRNSEAYKSELQRLQILQHTYTSNLRHNMARHILYTERLTLTPFFNDSTDDLDLLLAMFNDPVSLEKQGDFGLRTHDDLAKLLKACHIPPSRFRIQPANNPPAYVMHLGHHEPHGTPIGMISVVQRGPDAIPDMGWGLLQEYSGKGYATEAAKACLKYWTEQLGIEEIFVTTRSTNRGSYRIAEKLGFRKLEGGVRNEDGSIQTLYILPGMKEPPADMVFHFHGAEE